MDEDGAVSTVFGRRVAEARESLGLTLVELGERAGMSKAYVWRVEQGRTLPSLRNILRLAKALDMTVAQLLENFEREAGI